MKERNISDLMSKPNPSKMHSFIHGDEMIIPVFTEAGGDSEGPMTAEEFMKFTHKMSDKELNQFLYRRAKETIEMGWMPKWPEDDWGVLAWFQFSFITPEMRKVFPAIVREYLAHEPMIGTEFKDAPYARLNEETWEDALYFRILVMMVMAARRGSLYSRNFLISLYKVYYKSEYNRVKKLKTLTFLDLLNIHDEDCKRRGLPSGHATDGETSFRDYIIEKRKHEAGWTCIESVRQLDPAGKSGKRHEECDDPEQAAARAAFKDANDYVRSMQDAPDEPPLQPVASRLFIMCEILRIPIDETCNEQAYHMVKGSEALLDVNYLGNTEMRKLTDELIERSKEYTIATFPETADPYLYQTDEKYLPLEMAECVLWGAFRQYDRNLRIPYDSKKFDLPELMARVSLSLHQYFPDMEQNFYTVQALAMVQYLCECLCELMISRDQQLDDLLHFSERKHKEEWQADVDADAAEQGEKLLKSMETLHGTEYVKPEVKPYVEPEVADDIDSLKAEVERLKNTLAEREAVLAEAEQKVIRQRALYEQSKTRTDELEHKVADAAVEHSELIALREYVYSIRDEQDIPELDEATQEQMIKDLQNKNVAVLGGTERWVKRMKRLFPKWSFVSVEDESIGGFNALERASYIYMYTSAMKHKQYYRAMNLIEKEGKMLFYLGSTNKNENIIRFHRDLCKNGG